MPDLEAVARSAVRLHAFGVAGAIRVEIRRHTVLTTLLTIGADRRCGAAQRAVLEADRAPIGRDARLLAHAGATGEPEQANAKK